MHDDLDLLHGPAEHLADLLGCSVRTARRYKSGSTDLPEPCRRLLRLRRRGDLAALLGDAWEGFSFSAQGLLFVPGWANGMRPEQVRAMFFVFQEAAALRGEKRNLNSIFNRCHRIEQGRFREQAAGVNVAGSLHFLRDLIGLQVGNDCYSADHAQRDVLGAGHG